MSIGLVLKVTYNETCEVCDKIAQFTKRAFTKIIELGESIGYARAASHLASMGYHEEAKACMMELGKLKK